jgi:long-chain acyl-CoA synthetase
MPNITSWLVNSVQRTPEKPCLVSGGHTWTYQQVWQKVLAVRAMLQQHGVGQQDRVILYADNSLEYVVAYFAIALSGAIIVPISKMRENLVPFVVDNTQAKLLLTQKSLSRKLHTEPLPATLQVVMLDESQDSDSPAPAADLSELDGRDTDPVLILYTSGTTMNPLGVTLTHRNLAANTASILQYLHLSPDDSVLVTIPLAYSYGNSLLLTHICVGGTIYIDNRAAYPVTILEQLRATGVTGYSTVGSYLNLLLKQDPALYTPAMQSLRYITFAGEAAYTNDIKMLHELAPNLLIYVMYGQTEASARLSYLPPEEFERKLGSIGKGIPNTTLRVVSAAGQDVQPGEIGEIIVQGANVMPGYWQNDEKTREVLRDGWLYTGDMATVDEEGFIYIKGRSRDIIKYLGHRISPVEIETVINTFDEVLESAVIETRNAQGAVIIRAYIVPKQTAPAPDVIVKHVKHYLPPFMVPHEIEYIAEIPKTFNSKIQRAKLRELA